MAYNATNPNGQATSANSAPVVIASDQSTVKTKLATDIANTVGSITSSSSVITATNLSGVGSVTIAITGTFTGVAATFEGSIDGTNWVALPAQPIGTITPTLVLATGTIATGTYLYNISPLLGIQQLHVKATAWGTGTASVTIVPSAQFTQYAVNVATMPTTAVSGTVTTNFAANSIAGINPTTTSIALTSYYNDAFTLSSGTAVAVVTGTRRMYEYDFYNPNTSAVWIQFFAAAPTLGTTNPLRSVYIPATSGRDWSSPYSVSFGTGGIYVAVTTTSKGNSAPASAIQAYIGYI